MNNYYIERNEKYWQQTAKCLGLDHCHLLGIPYEGQGLIAIIEISLKTNKTTKPNIRIICLRVFVVYYLSSDEGCILKMKWCPKYSESEQEIGLLGVVTALGIF